MKRAPNPMPLWPSQSPLRHRPQIDGLRAIAMLGVLWVHFHDDTPATEGLLASLFFVVSGFLTTHILYTAKVSGGQVHVLNFYARRALRLLPPVFITVLIGAAFDILGLRAEAYWHLLQISDVRFALLGTFEPWVVSHLWSVNLLEKFYLIWPVVILLLPLRLIYAVTLTIIVSLGFVYANQDPLGVTGWGTILVVSVAPIAFGALAYLLQREDQIATVLRSYAMLAVSLAVIFSPLYLWNGFGDSVSYRLLTMPALAVIVTGAFAGYRGPVGWALASPVAQFAARISYGVYIYHLLVWWALGEVFPGLYTPSLTTFAVVTSATVLVAVLSWYLVERPVSRLRRYLPVSSGVVRPAHGARTPVPAAPLLRGESLGR